MMSKVLLCADDVSVGSPELLGLEGERLEAHPWLLTVADGLLARELVQAGGELQEVWVASCDNVEPINLAAALKHDAPSLEVLLVCPSGSGSVRSRAAAAGIDEVLDMRGFLDRYARAKSRWSGSGQVPSPVPDPVSASMVAPSHVPEPPLISVANAGRAADSESASVANAGYMPGPASASDATPELSAEVGLSSYRGHVLTVAGGSGGVGKSSLVAVLACIACRAGAKTAVLDVDMQFGDMDVLLGREECLRSDECLDALDKLASLGSSREGPALLAAPLRMEMGEAVMPRIDQLVRQLRSRFDVVLVNTGSNWEGGLLRLLEESGNVLFLMDQRPSSVRSLKRGLDLCARCGIASAPFLFALNRCRRGSALSSVDASCALGGLPVLELSDGGSEVEEALALGSAGSLVDGGNAFARSAAQLLVQLFPGVDGDAAVVKSLLAPQKGRILHRWRRSASQKKGGKP